MQRFLTEVSYAPDDLLEFMPAITVCELFRPLYTYLLINPSTPTSSMSVSFPVVVYVLSHPHPEHSCGHAYVALYLKCTQL